MKDSYNILLRLAGFQMGFKTYFTFCSFNEGIYNCCLASCCFFLFFFRLYCCTKTDQRVLIFLSPKMTGTQSRPSGNKSTSPQIKKKKKKVNAFHVAFHGLHLFTCGNNPTKFYGCHYIIVISFVGASP